MSSKPPQPSTLSSWTTSLLFGLLLLRHVRLTMHLELGRLHCDDLVRVFPEWSAIQNLAGKIHLYACTPKEVSWTLLRLWTIGMSSCACLIPKAGSFSSLGALRDEKHVWVVDSCRSRSLASNKSQMGATSGV